MRKDLILTFSVVLGIAGLVFGAGLLALAPLLENPAPPAAALAAVASPPAAMDVKFASGEMPGPTSTPALDDLEIRYNDFLARNLPDDCRAIALKAVALAGRGNAKWQIRLGDATFNSELLPRQQRFVKAHECYSGALERNPDAESREHAQRRICLCLRQLGRWEELVQSARSYLDQFKGSARAAEVRVLYAEGLTVLGKNAEASAELEAVTASDAPEAVRAQAMSSLAQFILKEARSQDLPAPPLAAKPAGTARETIFAAPIIKQEFLSQLDEAIAKPETRAADAHSENEVPEAQWSAVKRALERTNVNEARRLMAPFESDPDGGRRAKTLKRFADLMLDIATDNATRETRK